MLKSLHLENNKLVLLNIFLRMKDYFLQRCKWHQEISAFKNHLVEDGMQVCLVKIASKSSGIAQKVSISANDQQRPFNLFVITTNFYNYKVSLNKIGG